MAVRVNRLEGGPHGFLIAGTRTSGAAIWTSRSGAATACTRARRTGQHGAARPRRAPTSCLAGRWLVVGLSTGDAGRSATTWAPARPGRWPPQVLPGGARSTAAERSPRSAGLLVAGLLDGGFGVWTLDGARGRPARRSVGRTRPLGAAYVSGLAVTGSLVLATYSDGDVPAGGRSRRRDPVRPCPTVSVTVSGDHDLAVAGGDGRCLLVTDDGTRGRVWVANAPG